MTKEQLAEIFTEWDRRYRENPETFMSEAQHLLQHTAASYGELAAAYFLWLIDDMTGDVK